MEAVDDVYWNKCIDKVMKEAEQYLIYDGIIAPPCDTSSTENDGIPNSNVSEFVTISSVSKARSTEKRTKKQLKPVKKRSGLRIRQLVVQQCTKDLISPAELSSRHGISIRTIQMWVTSSGAKLPLKYKKKIDKVQKVKLDPRIEKELKKIEKSAKKRPSLSLSVSLHCPMCEFETSRKGCLDSHIKSHISCEQCGQVLLGKRQMAVHLTTHKPKKNYFCDFCNMDCKKCSNKKKHMKICKKRPE